MFATLLTSAIALQSNAGQPSGVYTPPSSAHLFAATGPIGPLMLLASAAALFIVIRRSLELRASRLAPAELERTLDAAVHAGQLDQGLERAVASPSLLGELVAAGLYLRKAGLDEMLANVERAATKESLRQGNRVANLARLGGVALLVGVFGSTTGLMSTFFVIAQLKAPVPGDFTRGIGESLASTALGLMVALFCFVAFFWFDSRLTQRVLAVREVAEEMMRDAAERTGSR
jgi:biopolymer transport protein ExbB